MPIRRATGSVSSGCGSLMSKGCRVNAGRINIVHTRFTTDPAKRGGTVTSLYTGDVRLAGLGLSLFGVAAFGLLRCPARPGPF